MNPPHRSCPSGSSRSFTLDRFRHDNRAVSTAVNYVLNIAVATLLMGALLITGSGLVDDQRERAVRTELRVLGGQLADGVATADRLANTNGTQSAVIERSLPRTVAGETYMITVHGGSDPYLLLSTSDPDVEVGVNLTLLTDTSGDPNIELTPSTVSGGDLRIVYDTTVNECGTSDALEVCDG